jgi:hypothetical protein
MIRRLYDLIRGEGYLSIVRILDAVVNFLEVDVNGL